jgi:hypothetical protein
MLIHDDIRQAQDNEENHFSNPINAYLFIKHLTLDWHNIANLLPNGKTTFLAEFVLHLV